MEAKLSKRKTPNVYCRQTTADYVHVWVAARDFQPLYRDCYIDMIRLRDLSHNATRFANASGVELRPAFAFGSTAGIEILDPLNNATRYYYAIAEHLVSRHGYRRGQSLFGASYDFRLAPLGNAWWMRQMRELVERSVERNNGSRAVLVAHSLGTVYTWRFLREQSAEWRARYVDSYVSLAGAWGGTAFSILAVVTGG